MGRKLDAFPTPSAQRYPWQEWLDGDPWELVRGEDFDAKTATFLGSARSQAQRRGGKIRTRTYREDGGDRVVLQFVRP